MPTDQKSNEKAQQPGRAEDDLDRVSLVDYLDNVDRAAFRRALALRDTYYPLSRQG
jgi:hypothetical protein